LRVDAAKSATNKKRGEGLVRRGSGRLPGVLVVLAIGGTVVILIFVTTQSPSTSPIEVAANPIALVVDSQRGRAIIVSNPDVTGAAGTASVIDVRRKALVRVTTVGVNPQRVTIDPRSGHTLIVNDGDGTRMTSGSVSGLDTDSGALLWTTSVGVWPTMIAVDAGRARAFVGNSGSGTVSVLDTRTGHVLRTIPVAMGALMPVEIADDARSGRVFVLLQPTQRNGPDRVVSFAAGSGAVVWTAPLPPNSGSLTIDEAYGHLVVDVWDAPGRRGGVQVLDGRSGRLVHTIPVPRAEMVAVDAPTGKIIVCQPVVRGQEVIVLDARTATPVGARSWPGHPVPCRMAVDAHTGRVVVLTAGWHDLLAQRLQLVDGATGALIVQSAPAVSPDVTALTIDGETGQAIVVNRRVLVSGREQGWMQLARHWFPWLPGLSSPRRRPVPVTFGSHGSVSIIDLR